MPPPFAYEIFGDDWLLIIPPLGRLTSPHPLNSYQSVVAPFLFLPTVCRPKTEGRVTVPS
ncbi:hypothetical protein VI817_008601 [Penicillium citrinum]|nr:hypothetical protein VI817_008601 [Penicillium citrinum]